MLQNPEYRRGYGMVVDPAKMAGRIRRRVRISWQLYARASAGLGLVGTTRLTVVYLVPRFRKILCGFGHVFYGDNRADRRLGRRKPGSTIFFVEFDIQFADEV